MTDWSPISRPALAARSLVAPKPAKRQMRSAEADVHPGCPKVFSHNVFLSFSGIYPWTWVCWNQNHPPDLSKSTALVLSSQAGRLRKPNPRQCSLQGPVCLSPPWVVCHLSRVGFFLYPLLDLPSNASLRATRTRCAVFGPSTSIRCGPKRVEKVLSPSVQPKGIHRGLERP